MKPKSIRFPEPLYDEVSKAAEQANMSVNKYILKCLEDTFAGEIPVSERLKKLEDFSINLRWQIAVQSTYGLFL